MSKVVVRKELEKVERENLNKYSDIVAHLLFHRGVSDNEEADKFLNPNYDEHLHDPFLFLGMEEAVEHTLNFISEGKRICIYGDYDADGIPATVILSDFFEKIGFENFFVYIPHRNKEGFGLNMGAIDKIKEQGADLIITVDCGIADVEEVDYANSLGIDVIITDHHEPNGKEPNAKAIINHKQPNCNYPDKNLCGSGVCFKFVQAMILEGCFDINEGWEKWLLDLVGLATLSDMVPLVGENRVFAKYGLMVLGKTKRKGIQKIFEKRRVDTKNLSADDVVFMVTPKINAASRMGDPMLAYELLKETDDMKAEEAVKHLEKINNERKGQVAVIVKEIKKHIESEKREARSEKITAVGYGNPEWQPSLLGLACNSIAEEYKVPVFLWGRGEGTELKGSCRTGNGDNLVELMNELEKEGVLDTFGGHHGAGGFEIKLDKVALLESKLEEILARVEAREHEEIVDMKISIDDIDVKLIEEINKLAPFGVGNTKPAFLLENISPTFIRNFGQNNAHLEVTFAKSNKSLPAGRQEKIRAVEFYKTAEDLGIEVGKIYNLIVNLEINNFNNKKEARVKIVKILKDLKM